jgi:hypothetical protein
MHPKNIRCITAAGIDCCVLANNHALDWGTAGLEETLDTLEGAGVEIAGAGRDLGEATVPAVLRVPGKERVLVFAFGARSSGIPAEWAAADGRPGVSFVPDLSGDTVQGDLVVASIHWGPNWGYAVPREQRRFAHRLIDEAGVDVVHGHSSHHPRGIEVYRGRPIIYGCGDLLNDYEGIAGREEYRAGLVLLYFPRMDPLAGDAEPRGRGAGDLGGAESRWHAHPKVEVRGDGGEVWSPTHHHPKPRGPAGGWAARRTVPLSNSRTAPTEKVRAGAGPDGDHAPRAVPRRVAPRPPPPPATDSHTPRTPTRIAVFLGPPREGSLRRRSSSPYSSSVRNLLMGSRSSGQYSSCRDIPRVTRKNYEWDVQLYPQGSPPAP